MGTLFRYLWQYAKIIVIVVLLFITLSAVLRFTGLEGGKQPDGMATEQVKKEVLPKGMSDYQLFLQAIEEEKIERIHIRKDGIIDVRSIVGDIYQVYYPSIGDPSLMNQLSNHKEIKIITDAPKGDSWIGTILTSFGPILLLLAVWIYFARKMQGGAGGMSGQAGAFGKAKAQESSADTCPERFDDVAGCDQAKEEVKVAISLLKNPKRFEKLGGKAPRGLLFLGPPGTGKTLLARAVAGEAGVKFLSMSGGEFVEMFVGVGASRVRDLFAKARAMAPCILFIDEIDAVGKKRGGGATNGNSEHEQTLNQLLVEMDGFDTSAGIILIGATNRPDVLDAGLLRPGRFDTHITLDLPNLKAREQVIDVHLKGKPCAPDVDRKAFAQGSTGMSPADLANICNGAALNAGLAGRDSITMRDIEDAKDKVLMGAERPTLVMTEEDKRMTAAHEAGHIIVGQLSPEHDPVYKASIMPRAKSLGITMFLPPRDMISKSITALESMLDALYGGRIVEELVFGPKKITTGASNDIERASGIARAMVTQWGMSKLGPVAFVEEGGGAQFLGGRGMFQSKTSESTAQAIDIEVKRILDESYERATQLIQANRKPLDVLTEALLKWETIGVVQITEILEGKELAEVTPPPGFGEQPVIVSETKEETTHVDLTNPEGKQE